MSEMWNENRFLGNYWPQRGARGAKTAVAMDVGDLEICFFNRRKRSNPKKNQTISSHELHEFSRLRTCEWLDIKTRLSSLKTNS
jgi:hypothetical protein